MSLKWNPLHASILGSFLKCPWCIYAFFYASFPFFFSIFTSHPPLQSPLPDVSPRQLVVFQFPSILFSKLLLQVFLISHPFKLHSSVWVKKRSKAGVIFSLFKEELLFPHLPCSEPLLMLSDHSCKLYPSGKHSGFYAPKLWVDHEVHCSARPQVNYDPGGFFNIEQNLVHMGISPIVEVLMQAHKYYMFSQIRENTTYKMLRMGSNN